MTQTVFNCGYKEDCAYYKKLNETLKELNDMAEFKDFGKSKEIIIDGVDVARCKYLCTNQMGNNCLNHNRGFSMNCKNTADCYYKQLKRLEQENTELKAENERLNRCLLEALHHENKALNESIKLKERFKKRGELMLKCAKQREQLKQTMQEIKVIAETELSYDMVGNEHRHYKNYEFIRHLITKAEEK